MKKTIAFNQGVQFPPKLGTLILKKTVEGKASYAQNIDFANDEYGNGAVVPGPALTTITNNSELTGVPIVREVYVESNTPTGYLYFAQGILGTKAVIRRVKNIVSGSTPEIDTSFSITVDHQSHSTEEIVDMVMRPTSGEEFQIYVAGKDTTDTWVGKFRGDLTPSSLSDVATNGNFTSGLTNQFLVYSTFDNNIYWIGKQRISSIDSNDNVTVNALSLGLPLGSFAICGADWQQQLVVAYSNMAYGDFSLRKAGGKAGIAVWDYLQPGILRNVPAPCRYISALVPAPDGNLLVFGGVDEGKSAIYSFTGYGFNLLTQYIGDIPRSRHSTSMDAQGRIVWMTCDGQLCRYDFISGIFEHLGSITTGSSAGGLLAKAVGSPTGNEFIVASGTGSTYSMKLVQFGKFIGDNDGDDGITTPMTVTGIQTLPQGSTIQGITLHLAKSLESGEQVEVRVYKNGSTDYITYMNLNFSEDGTISSKRTVKLIPEVNSYSVAAVWKMTDGSTTAPPVLSVDVEVESKH